MSGDHPTIPLRSQPVDVVSWLRCEADAAAREPAPWQMLSKAASEIERLRKERNAFKKERDELISISNKLKRERDEARREWCIQSIEAQKENRAPVRILAKKLAEDIRGWDCFKESINA